MNFLKIFLLASSYCLIVQAKALPSDVKTFLERREKCDHFRGEEAYDKEREKFINEQLTKFCKGTDKELAAIRHKYRDNPSVIRKLFNLDDTVE